MWKKQSKASGKNESGLDTNVFISGIFWEGNFCSQIVTKWRNEKFELVSSVEILNELIKTLKEFNACRNPRSLDSVKMYGISPAVTKPKQVLHFARRVH